MPSSSRPTSRAGACRFRASTTRWASLFITPKDGYSFTAAVGEDVVVDAIEGSLGAHGYPATDPELGALFIASGAGINAGSKLDVIDNVDVAPTLAALLGLTLENMDGRVLTEILTPKR